MKIRYLVFFMAVSFVFASCQKNTMSNIPQISLIYFGSETGTDSIFVNIDTPVLQFSIIDGSADLGNNPNGTQYDIYINDMRFDTGYAGYFFPAIDQSIENPKKGIEGTCTFFFVPSILQLRPDSLHQKYGDTTHFLVYIEDKAGHHSDTIVTPSLIIRP